ncbi:NitT/TauT family transport system substrate-binding protein [Lacrimispora xylanisolvens]|uniref:NitT/TauT family transport system substrate-binding protein n=1 Tax=Lacrimispora xylanisolvens TaxID=384636 RepID=A0A2S6HPD4_9FIRM|nr:ABC transporter substrate-binding protein [Hungatella xylanolytica]PPK79401.1 NitT/TauT family transport system substrate-binding protein [Hungatella xylanolytica]
MKKVLSALAALAMTAVVLTGCAKSSPQASAPAPESTSAAQTTAAPETTKAPEPSKAEGSKDSYTLKIGSLKGPTSMGLVKLMDKAKNGETGNSYEFTMVTAADELLGKIVSGELDVALIPANMSSILYTKTKHNVTVLDINTMGVLYAVSSDDSIHTTADLKGKTVYLTGKGTTPDYALNYVLKANGLTADDVKLEYKSEAAEVAAVLKEKPDAVGLLPQPFVTAAMAQNDQLKMVLDLNKEWDAAAKEGNGSLVTGVTVCRNDVLKDHKEAIDQFLADHKESAEFANNNVSEAAALVAAAGIIEKAPVAEKAIPFCSITYVDGEKMKSLLSGYLNVLYEMEPQTVGGALPGDDFYYMHQ